MSKLTLWQLPVKTSATVVNLSASLSEHVLARLHEMGVEIGREISCIRRGPFNGPIVLEMGGSVFALEKELAAQINIHLFSEQN